VETLVDLAATYLDSQAKLWLELVGTPAVPVSIPARSSRWEWVKIGDGSELFSGTTSVIRNGFPRSRVGLAWEPARHPSPQRQQGNTRERKLCFFFRVRGVF